MTSLHWGTYPILTFPDVPEVEIELIDGPREKPWGAGEPAAAVVASAISNAVFDATGVRLRSGSVYPNEGESCHRSDLIWDEGDRKRLEALYQQGGRARRRQGSRLGSFRR